MNDSVLPFFTGFRPTAAASSCSLQVGSGGGAGGSVTVCGNDAFRLMPQPANPGYAPSPVDGVSAVSCNVITPQAVQP